MGNPLPRGVRRLFRLPWRDRQTIVAALDDEVRFHLEMRAAELAAAGMPPDEAMAEARRRFGDPRAMREYSIDVDSRGRRRAAASAWFGACLGDLRLAMRQHRKSPAFATIAVLTLALGIGANSAIFSVVHHVVLSPLPYADGSRIVTLVQSEGDGMILFAPSHRMVEAWRARAHTLEALSAGDPRQVRVGDGARRERVPGGAIEPNLLDFLGVHPVAGRGFTRDDARTGAAPVALLGYGLWQRRYAGRTDAIGSTIVVDDTSRTIVGVAPPNLTIPFQDDQPLAVLTPLPTAAAEAPMGVLGKLRRGVSAAQATRELSAIAASLPPPPGRTGTARTDIRAMRAQDFLGATYRRALLLLFGATGLVLLIACANVANLLLVRAWGRQREFAVRVALGAGRGRLVRQLLAESIVLSAVAGALGLLLAWGGLRVFLALRPAGLENLGGVRVEPAVLLWTMLVALGTGVAFGVAPAWSASGRAPGECLKSGTRATGGRGSRRVRNGLVVGEIALSVVLLIGAGLLLRSFRAIEHVDLGFDPHGLASAEVGLPATMPTEQRRAIFADLLERIRALPEVERAEMGGDVPPTLGVSAARLEVDGATTGAHVPRITGFDAVQPGYFGLARISLRGHTFSGDTTGRLPAKRDEVILGERLARQLFPDGRALGRRMRGSAKAPWMTVVGIAHDIAVPGQRGDRYDLQYYVPAFTEFPSTTILLRSRLSIDALLPTLRRVLAATHPALEIQRSTSSMAQIAELLAAPRFAMALVGAFALLALLLSAVGLYGVIAYAVGERTREIGVRVALGAAPRDVATLVLRDGARLAGAGVVIGIPAAMLSGRALRAFLFEIGSTDPATYAAVAVLLAAVGLLAAYLPARRAMRVDPVVALGAE